MKSHLRGTFKHFNDFLIVALRGLVSHSKGSFTLSLSHLEQAFVVSVQRIRSHKSIRRSDHFEPTPKWYSTKRNLRQWKIMKRGSWLKLKARPFPNIKMPSVAFRSSIHLFHPEKVSALKTRFEYWCNERQFYHFNIRPKVSYDFFSCRNQERLRGKEREREKSLWMNSRNLRNIEKNLAISIDQKEI